MGLFSNIANAQYSEGGNYLKEGVFRLEILKVVLKKTRKGVDSYIVEFKVHESDNPAHRPGSEVTWLVGFDKEPAMGNVKQFIATACGTTDLSGVDEATAELTVSAEQPLTGKFVRASAVNITTKAGRPFTKVKFMLDSLSVAEMAAAHAANK